MRSVAEKLAPLKRMNWLMNAVVLIIIAVGVLFIHSACHVREDATAHLHQQQIVWAAVGLAVYLAIALVDYRRLRDVAWWFCVMTAVLLVAVLFVGTRIYGAKRWLMFMGVGVQPSELGKLAVIVAGACLLSPPAEKYERTPSIWWSFLLAGIPMALIAKEPDLGSSLVFLPIVMVMLFATGAPLKPLLSLVAGGIVIVAAVLGAVALPEKMGMSPEHQDRFFRAIHLSGYQRDRIEVFLNIDSDPKGVGWNKRQSQIAVGSGGLMGKGYMKGTQNILGYLPRTVAPTDFIFPVIAEETGFIGSALLLGLYALLLGCGLYAALMARDKMGRMLCVGVVAMIFTHVFVNVAMTIGLVPIVGIPLPLISYGGTFMVVTLFALGLIQSVYVRRQSF